MSEEPQPGTGARFEPVDPRRPDRRPRVSGDIKAGDGGVFQAGEHAVMTFLAGAALTPFLQALVGVVGTRIGGRLDDATRGALRRVLRRELDTPRRSGGATFLCSEGGAKIRLDAVMPEEALPQLLTMTFEMLEQGDLDAPTLIRWTSAGWLATVARAGQLHDLTWDSEQAQWVSPPASLTP